MMQKNIKALVIAMACILSMAIYSCSRGTDKNLKKLKSVVTVVRFDRYTGQEKPVFIYRANDFKYIVIVHHLLLNPFKMIPNPFEVRGILNKKLKKTYEDFISVNLNNKIVVLLDKNLVSERLALEEPIDYVPLGYYASFEQASAVARKLTFNPKYEDWRPRETRERDQTQKELERKQGL